MLVLAKVGLFSLMLIGLAMGYTVLVDLSIVGGLILVAIVLSEINHTIDDRQPEEKQNYRLRRVK